MKDLTEARQDAKQMEFAGHKLWLGLCQPLFPVLLFQVPLSTSVTSELTALLCCVNFTVPA